MEKIDLKNKIISFYNIYTKLKWWRKILLLVYFIFTIFAIVFFTIQMKYPLRAIRPNLDSYQKIKTTPKNYLNLGYNEEISKSDSYKLVYNYKTNNIDLYYKTHILSVIPLTQYGSDKGYDENTLLTHFKYPNEQEENILSPFIAYLSYSSTPGEAREITYKMVSIKSIKKVANYNGVLINYQIQSDPLDNSLFPKAINASKMKELVRKTKKHFKNNKLDYQPYLSSLSLSYIKSGDKSSNNLYNFILPSEDIIMHKNNLKYIWYSIYKLTDSELMKFNPNARINKYSFTIPIMYYLENNAFKVSIISDLIKEESITINNSKWQLSSIKLNPNLLLTKKEAVKEAIIPDGNGALIDNMDIRWNGVVYNANRFLVEPNYSQLPPDIKIPFIGLVNKKDTKQIASYFYIEDGASNANLYLDPFINYTRIYPEFYLRRTGNATFIGESTTIAQSPAYYDTRYTVAYHFLIGDELTYFNIADDIASKYIKKDKIEFINDMATEFLGAIAKLEHFLGIPYYKDIKMTSFSEAKKIIEMIKDYSKTYFYTNWQRDFLYQNIPAKKTKSLKKLGSSEILNEYNIYYVQSFLKTYNNNYQLFSNRLNGMQTLSNEIKKLYDYSPITNSEVSDKLNRYYLLSNKYLLDTINRYQGTQYNNLAIDDFNIPNYNYSDVLFSPKVIDEIKARSIHNLKRNKLAINYPGFNLINNADLIYDIKVPTKNKTNIKSPIPFYQLVLRDYYQLYLETKNLFDDYISGDTQSYYLEYQLISNTKAKYTLTHEKTNITKETYYYNKYNSCYYQDYLSEMNMHQRYISDFYQKYGTKIVAHKVIDYNVFEVKFDNDGILKTILFNLTGGTYLGLAPYSHKEI